MRKTTIILSLVLILLVGVVNATVCWQDNFNRGNQALGANWTVSQLPGAGYYANITNNVLTLKDSAGSACAATANFSSFANCGELFNVSFSMKSSETLNKVSMSGIFNTMDYTDPLSTRSVKLQTVNNQSWQFGTKYYGKMLPNVWYDIILEVNDTGNKFDAYVNGTLVVNDEPFEHNTPPDVIHFRTNAPDASYTNWYDDFVVQNATPSPLSATPVKVLSVNVTSFDPPQGQFDDSFPFGVFNGTDSTPTIKAVTDINSNCTFAGVEMSGNGTTTHVSTVSTPLPFGISNVLLSCVNSLNASLVNSSNVTFNISFEPQIEVFYVNTTEGQDLSVDMRININSSFYTSAYLTWNGTNYTATKYNGDPYYTYFNATIPAFLVQAANYQTYYFNWTYQWNYSNSPSITTNLSDTYTQRIYRMALVNCSATSPLLLYNITLRQEDTIQNLNGTVESALLILSTSNSTNRSFTYEFSGGYNYYICYANNTNFSIDSYMRSVVSGGFTHRYYTLNDSIGSVIPIDLYNFNYTTGISDLKITVRDRSTYQYMENVYAKLLRYYPGEGVWRTVQMDRSDDYGLLFYNIKEESTDYRVIFMDSYGRILQSTESMKFACTSGVCDLTYLLDPYSVTAADDTLVFTFDYDNDTSIVSVTWNDIEGLPANVNTIVTKESMGSTLVICNLTSLSAASGTHLCNISGYTGTVLVRSRSSRSPTIDQIAEWIEILPLNLKSVIGQQEGAFWSFAITTISMGLGTFNPIGGIIGVIFGLVVIYLLGLMNTVNVTFLITITALGIVVGMFIRRKR